MRNKYYISLILLLPLLFICFYSCSNDTTVAPPVTTEGISQSLTSNDQGNISYNDFKLVFPVGTVPAQSNGSPGTVVFSLNSSSSLPGGLNALPAGYTQVGNFLQAGPDNFIFASTIKVFLPAGSESSPTNLSVMTYVPADNKWEIISSNSGTDSVSGKHYMMVDVLQLGYFVIVKNTSSDHSVCTPQGGVQWCINDGLNFIILTVKSAVFSDPSICTSNIAGGMIGATFISPNIPGMVFPSDYCRGIVPVGTYEFWISSRSFSSNDIQTYSLPLPVTVTNSLNWPITWVYNGGEGWTIMGCNLPPGGTWMPGRPQNWPTPTIPYGSGTVQATLTWTNSSGTEADMDLHLYGPNNLHVFWQSPTATNFALDRDWQLQDGNAVENIYSTTTTVPSGSYRVNVAHFSGAAKSFNCRVIVNGSVTNYSGNLQDASVDVRTFTIP